MAFLTIWKQLTYLRYITHLIHLSPFVLIYPRIKQFLLFQSIQPNNFHFINPARFPKEAYIYIYITFPLLIAPFTTTCSFSPRQKTVDSIATLFRIAKEAVVPLHPSSISWFSSSKTTIRERKASSKPERSATVRQIVPVNCSRQIRASFA